LPETPNPQRKRSLLGRSFYNIDGASHRQIVSERGARTADQGKPARFSGMAGPTNPQDRS
jgi:hypothetical protein